MKSFDSYSIRGIVFSVLGTAGIAYEVIRKSTEAVVLILYTGVVLLGLSLLLFIQSPDS